MTSIDSTTRAREVPKRSARGRTTTARFGSGRRESHDASAFYGRFVAPEISDDSTVEQAGEVDVIHHHDARDMGAVASNSVALVVTSPPYFAGKEYEESLGHNGVPGSYFEYLQLLGDVFAECKRVLEPGGRIAVNVANLGRRPYRSLAGDVTDILQDLGLLLRGEVVWWKGRAAGGSCAWGTFQQPGNPVLRDVTERIVVAGKGRFDRAVPRDARQEQGLPAEATISRDEFLEATTDLWAIAPESATRVGHPAPFPVDLPRRLIEMYTYAGDVVLDPFAGSGSAAVAAVRTGRRYIGFDTDAKYVKAARARIAEEAAAVAAPATTAGGSGKSGRSGRLAHSGLPDRIAEAVASGHQAKEVARILVEEAGFVDIRTEPKYRRPSIDMALSARDKTGQEWAFDVSGAFTTNDGGLGRTEALWKALGKAAVFHQSHPEVKLVLLTTSVPSKASTAGSALRSLVGPDLPVFDVIELLDSAGVERLAQAAGSGAPAKSAKG